MNRDDLIRNKQNFIQISPEGLAYGYRMHWIIEPDGLYSWHLPSFDIYFSSETKEEGEQRCRVMAKSFFSYWLKNQGFRSFALHILKLGYKTTTHEEFKSLLNRTNLKVNLKYSSNKLPPEFANAETSEQEDTLAIAV